LKTGSGRQGHSWVRIPPPPLIEPKLAWLSRFRRLIVSVPCIDPLESAEIRCLTHGGAAGAQFGGLNQERPRAAPRARLQVQTRPFRRGLRKGGRPLESCQALG